MIWCLRECVMRSELWVFHLVMISSLVGRLYGSRIMWGVIMIARKLHMTGELRLASDTIVSVILRILNTRLLLLLVCLLHLDRLKWKLVYRGVGPLGKLRILYVSNRRSFLNAVLYFEVWKILNQLGSLLMWVVLRCWLLILPNLSVSIFRGHLDSGKKWTTFRLGRLHIATVVQKHFYYREVPTILYLFARRLFATLDSPCFAQMSACLEVGRKPSRGWQF
jgi:hypothetical protein